MGKDAEKCREIERSKGIRSRKLKEVEKIKRFRDIEKVVKEEGSEGKKLAYFLLRQLHPVYRQGVWLYPRSRAEGLPCQTENINTGFDEIREIRS